MSAIERGPELYLSDTGLPFCSPVAMVLKEELRTEKYRPTPITEQKTGVVEIFSAARKIARPIGDYFHRVHERGNREGLEAAFAIDGFTVPFIPIVHSLLTAAIYAGANITDPRLTAAAAVAIIGVQIPRSIKRDAEALRKKHFDASTVGTIMYPFTGRAIATAIAEQGANIIAVGTVSLPSLLMGATGDLNIYPASIAAAGIMMPAWYTFVNSAIAHGELDQALSSLRQKQETFVGNIRHAIKK
jgi:hypothetical protein